MKSRQIPGWAIVLVASLFITSCGTSAGSADKPTATTISLNDFKKDLSNKVEAVYTAIRQSHAMVSQMSGYGMPVSDVISEALLKEGLYSKVEQGEHYMGLTASRNLCKGVGYDTLLNRLKPAEKVLNIEFAQKDFEDNSSEEFVFVPIQLSVFPDVLDSELESLYQNFSDVVSAEGSPCDSTYKVGTKCEKIEPPALANWYQESDLKKVGCSLGSAGKVAVTSTVEQVDYFLFRRAFVVEQISVQNKMRMAKTIVVLPHKALQTVFVLEVTAMRNGKNPSTSDVPSLIKVGNLSKRIASDVVDKWVNVIKEDFDLSSLTAQYDVIFNISND